MSDVLLRDDMRLYLRSRYKTYGITPLEIERVLAMLTANVGFSLYEQNRHTYRLMTEGRATGIPTIQKALRDNGSMAATIETDDNRTYFLLTIPCRHGFEEGVATISKEQEYVLDNELGHRLGQISVQVEEVVNQCIINEKTELGQILGKMFVQVWEKSRSKDNVRELISNTIDLLCLLRENDLSANNLNDNLSFDSTKELKRKIILPLIKLGYVAMTYPDKPTSAKQTYKLTEKGKTLF